MYSDGYWVSTFAEWRRRDAIKIKAMKPRIRYSMAANKWCCFLPVGIPSIRRSYFVGFGFTPREAHSDWLKKIQGK